MTLPVSRAQNMPDDHACGGADTAVVSSRQRRQLGRASLARRLAFSPPVPYLGGVQPALLAPLAQVVPLGPVATPLPFLVLDLPPPVV